MRFAGQLTRGLLAGALLTASLLAWGAPAAGAMNGRVPAPGATATVPAAAGLAPWHGGIDLYRAGTFSTQQTWLWCTAADIQIARNIVFHGQDHSYAGQQAYFAWMRARNRYRLPLSAGVDAQGWTAGFQHFVDGRYRLSASPSFDAALRSAVVNLRRTSLPVGITVDRGNHAWLMTGFTATADPAATTHFTVTSVRVVGPLYGLQSENGYDMPPDTRLTPAQLRTFFTPWYYAPTRMVWDGTYVSIEPVAPATPTPTATATPKPTAPPQPVSTASPGPTAAPPASATGAVATAATSPSTRAASAGPSAIALAASPASPADQAASAAVPLATGPAGVGLAGAMALAVLVLGAIVGVWVLVRRR